MLAAVNDFATLEALLKHSEINVNLQGREGNTALHYAILFNGKRRTEALIAHPDINLNIQNNLGQTPLQLAWGSWNPHLIQSPKADVKDREGNGPLLTVLKTSDFNSQHKLFLINLLLIGEDPDDINQTNNEGETPLMVAAKNDFAILEALLKYDKTDVNMQDNKGNTALHYAISANGKRRREALIAHPAINPNLQNKLGRTSLHLAWGDSQLVQILKEKGADESIQDKRGKTPYELYESTLPLSVAVVRRLTSFPFKIPFSN